MRFKKIVKMFKKGNVCVTGLRGTGKDVLTGNVVNRINYPYVSNLDYGENLKKKRVRLNLDLEKLDIKNNYNDFISGKINEYTYPYPKGADIYVSDAGVYFPSQYCNKLNNQYEGLVNFQALSRQIGQCNFHINVQNLNRLWDKIREQSELYIRCNWCKVLFGKYVIQIITIYDKYNSCLNRVKPCRVGVPLFGDKNARMNAKIYRDKWENENGIVKRRLLIYKNKSKHNTLYFGDLLGGKK